MGHLTAAAAVVLIVSFSWATAVQLTPAERRPYVGSSSANSPFDLAFGYNGLQRLLPASMTGADAGDAGDAAPPSPGAILGAFGAAETGERGPLRLFNGLLAGQIAWLLPLALVGFIAAWWHEPGIVRFPVSTRRTALLFWGGWLLTAAAFFAVANQFHRYYLVMLAPPIAALVGAGLAAFWTDWQRPGRRGRLLPVAVAGSAALAAAIARPFPVPGDLLAPVVLGLGVAAAIGLAAVRVGLINGNGPGAARRDPRWERGVASVAVAAGMAALLVGPTVWSAWALWTPVSNVLPAAGPGGSILPPLPGGGAIPGLDTYLPPDPALVAFLAANRDGERFVLATANSMSAAPLIIEHALPVAALGGFIGQDPIRSVEELHRMVETGEVRFFLVPDPGRVGLLTTMLGVFGSLTNDDGLRLPGFGPAGSAASPLPGGADPAAFLRLFLTANVRWVADSCEPVPAERWQTPGRASGNPLTGLESLYDCGVLRR